MSSKSFHQLRNLARKKAGVGDEPAPRYERAHGAEAAEQYKAAFGKDPHPRMKEETILKKVEEAQQ